MAINVDTLAEMNYEGKGVTLAAEPTNSAKPQWIQIFPRGKFWIEHLGRELEFNDTFFREMKTAFESESLSKPYIDIEHNKGESFGDILELRINDKGMDALIQLNADGVDAIKNKKYKYISPYFGLEVDTAKQVYKNRLRTVSLVNNPALEGSLPPLQAQLELSKKYAEEHKEQQMSYEPIAIELGLKADSGLEVVMTEIKTLKSKISDSVELSKKESEKTKKLEDQVIELSKELKVRQEAELKSEAEKVVNDAIKSGKIHPAVSEIYLSRYMKDKETVNLELSKIPADIFNPEKQLSKPFEEKKGVELSAEDKAKMAAGGLDVNDKESVEVYLASKAKLSEGGK